MANKKQKDEIPSTRLQVDPDDKKIIRQEAIKNNFDGFKPYAEELLRMTADKIRVQNNLPKNYQ